MKKFSSSIVQTGCPHPANIADSLSWGIFASVCINYKYCPRVKAISEKSGHHFTAAEKMPATDLPSLHANGPWTSVLRDIASESRSEVCFTEGAAQS